MIEEINNDLTRFKEIVDRIFELIMSYGIKSLFNSEGGQENVMDGKEIKDSFRDQLIVKVHKGWSLAQEKIYSELITLNEQRKVNKRQLKNANIKKDIDAKKKFSKILKFLTYKEYVFRKLADTIAWQILEMQDYTVKLFYRDLPLHSINNLNPSEMEYINFLNKKKQTSFALLADLSTFIQIGDVLIIDKSAEQTIVSIKELKEGKVNEVIRTHINSWYQSSGCPAFIYAYEKKYGDKKYKQFKRMFKQDYESLQVIRGFYEGIKEFPSKKPTIFPDKVFQLEYYISEINELLKEANEKGWATNIIEDCLYIGVYTEKYDPQESAFYYWVRNLGVKYPIVDFFSILSEPLALPPFLYPFLKKDIFDITLRKKKILFCLDLDKWIELGKNLGLKIYWLNRKESTREIQKSDSNVGPFAYEHRCIAFENSGECAFLGGGMLARIHYGFVKPTSILKILKDESLLKPPSAVKKQFLKPREKIGRNEQCLCGSGKKYKKCCGALTNIK